MPKPSSIRSSVSTELRLVTDRQTDRQTDRHSAIASTRAGTVSRGNKNQSCPWVGLTHGLVWIGLRWVEIFQFLVGWIGSTEAKLLKI